MIDEDRTRQLYGYTSAALSPQSHKKVIAVCEMCGRYRVVEKKAARPLCVSCGKVGRIFSQKTLQIKSDNMRGEKNPMYGKTGINHPSFGKPLSEEHKHKLSVANMGKKPSPQTIEKMRRNCNRKYGVDNHMWKGGVTPVMRGVRQSTLYKNWRKAVFERDDYTCRMCNVRGGKLEAHHIRPVRDHKNDLLMYDINNGITLCRGCHDMTKGNELDYVGMFNDMVVE